MALGLYCPGHSSQDRIVAVSTQHRQMRTAAAIGAYPSSRWDLGSRLEQSDGSAHDVFSGDARLATRMTIKVHDASITDLLADLGVQTSIRFFVDDAVSHDRLTLYAYDRPLAATLRALAVCCNYEWRRSAKDADTAYVLGRSKEASRQAADLFRRLQQEATDEILWEANEYSRLRKFTPAARQKEVERLLTEMATAKDPSLRHDLSRRYQVVASLGGDTIGRAAAVEVIRALGRNALLELFQHGDVEMSFPASADVQPIPQSAVDAALSAIPSGATIRSISIKVLHSQELHPSVRCSVLVRAGPGASSADTLYTVELPELPAEDMSADRPPTRGPLPSHFADTVTVALKSIVHKSSRGGTVFVSRPRLGDSLEELEKVHPMDVIADAFVSVRVPPLGSVTLPVDQMLDRLADVSRHEWWLEDGFVLMRSRDYEVVRASDPPPDAYARWIQAAQGDGLGLDDYAEMAGLTDLQWGTLSDLAARGDFPPLVGTVVQWRPHLRLWNSLDRKLRKAALSQGVTRAQMSPAQRKMLDAACAGAESEVWRLRVETYAKRLWGVRQGEGGMAADAGSRDLALQLFRQRDPSVQLQDVRMVVFTVYGFNYESRGGNILMHVFVTLPPHWEDAPAGV